MQIFFHGIFGRHASIFVLWEVKEPKECLSGHKQGRKSFFLQDAGFSPLESAGQSELWQDPSHSSATYWSTDGKWT